MINYYVDLSNCLGKQTRQMKDIGKNTIQYKNKIYQKRIEKESLEYDLYIIIKFYISIFDVTNSPGLEHDSI